MKKTLFPIVALALVVTVGGISGAQYAAAQSEFSLFYGPDLAVGSTGQGVTELQGLLSELGYLNVPISVPFGYFGPMTKDALARYQESIGVSNTGYYGPLTKDRMIEVFKVRGWYMLLYPNRI